MPQGCRCASYGEGGGCCAATECAQCCCAPSPPPAISPVGVHACCSAGSPSGRKIWTSYDEHDGDSEYAFQRKKRCGTKNGSEGVRYCLDWTHEQGSASGKQASPQQQQQHQYRLEGEEEIPRYKLARTEGARREEELFEKIGHPLSADGYGASTSRGLPVGAAFVQELRSLQGALSAQQAALVRNAAATAKLVQAARGQLSLAARQHQHAHAHAHAQGCPRSLQQVLDKEGEYEWSQRAQQDREWARAQEECSEDSERYEDAQSDQQYNQLSARHAEQEQALAQQQALQQQQAQQAGSKSPPKSGKKAGGGGGAGATSSQADAKAAALQRLSAARHAEAALGEGATHEAPVRAGLGNTLLGSPHDPRELHDPSQIDLVWRRRQEAKERAKRLNALLGTSASEKPVVDEKQYAESLLKQMSRRIKIQAFEKRHTDDRLAASTSPFTRELSETWMSKVVGKPPFCSFGNGNTAPASGGLVYGGYMASHNISPEAAPNRPGARQTTDEARRVAETKRKQDAKSLRRLLKQSQREGDSDAVELLQQAAEGMKLQRSPRNHLVAAAEARARPKSAGGARSSPPAKKPSQQSLQQRVDPDERPLTASQGRPSTAINSSGIASVPFKQQGQQGQQGQTPLRETRQQQSQQQSAPQQPLERAFEWHGRNADVASLLAQQTPRGGGSAEGPPAHAHGKRGDYDDSITSGRNNTLAETTARTMSVLPLPDRQTTAWGQGGDQDF